MAKKVYIQPGVWVVLIFLALVGGFFGLKALQKGGGIGKLSDIVAPKSGSATSSAKATKIDGITPVVVAINTWVGYTGLINYNGGLAPSKDSRFYKEQGILVQIVVMDNFEDSRSAFSSDRVNVISNTADVLPTEIASLQSMGPKVFMQVDWSRGGDKIVVRPGINTVADLKGKTIAVAPGTPSNTLLIRALETGALTWNDIKDKIVKVGKAPDAVPLFKSGNVDAAIVWAPDDEDCIKGVPGAKVLISTKEANFTIADVFYAKADYISKHHKEIGGFTKGVLIAAAEINASEDTRMQAQALAARVFNVPAAVVDMNFARFTTYGDNVNFFNLDPVGCKCVKGEDLYTKMAQAFNAIGMAPANLPSWREITDISILTEIKSSFTGPQNDAEPSQTFKAPTPALKTAPAVATKRITINFATGVYTLSDEARYNIDREFSAIAKSFAGYRVRIEGNTDNVGNLQSNLSLSKKRAQAVANYLSQTYSFDPNRFIIVGNGPNKPVADNSTEDGKAANRRTDFELVQE